MFDTTNLQKQAFLTPDLIDRLVKIRHHLHAHPELSGFETKTAGTIAKYLAYCQPSQLIEGLGGTGVAAVFDSGKKGKTVLFRSELDALPIQEINDLPYKSIYEGIGHKCGHDGHSTILLGLAGILSKEAPQSGRVVLLFQPAEENGEGAKAVLNDERFKQIEPDYAFAFHNLPGYPLNEIVIRENAFTAAVKSIIIKLSGKTAHAAEPEHGHNPALAIAEILKQSNELSNNDPNRADFAVVTPIHVEMGKEYYGISAGYGEIRLTFRTWTQKELEHLQTCLIDQINTIAHNHKLSVETEFTHVFQANENNLEAVEIIKQSAAVNDYALTEREYPFKWGEDFGLFTQQYKGAMFGIGSGLDSPALHNPDYDFPDEQIPVGILMFYNIAKKILG